MPPHDTPPAALQQAVDTLALRTGLRLHLVPSGRRTHWCVLRYSADGEACVFLPAMEAGALYATLSRLLEAPPHA